MCYSKHLNTRLVAAAWCLASCVLLYAYSCILTSFISAPNTQVLVKSINEIPENKNLRPVVIKKTGADLIVSVRVQNHLEKISNGFKFHSQIRTRIMVSIRF